MHLSPLMNSSQIRNSLAYPQQTPRIRKNNNSPEMGQRLAGRAKLQLQLARSRVYMIYPPAR